MDARALNFAGYEPTTPWTTISCQGYRVPLVGGGYGKVRLFEASRRQQSGVTPHSHRFDFTCLCFARFGGEYHLDTRRPRR